jgi:hypothetical protein
MTPFIIFLLVGGAALAWAAWVALSQTEPGRRLLRKLTRGGDAE